jgi:serine protease
MMRFGKINQIVTWSLVFLLSPTLVWASDQVINVRFAKGTDVSVPENAVDTALRSHIKNMSKLFSLSDATLDRMQAAGPDLPDLKLWFAINLADGADQGAFLTTLKGQANVDVAEIEGELSVSRLGGERKLAVTPDFQGYQGYLDAAPGGVDAKFAWGEPGGTGQGVKIYDVEFDWTQTHEDLSKAAGVSLLVPVGGAATPNDEAHGTAVVSMMVGDNNGIGVTGISYDSALGLSPVRNTFADGTTQVNVADAILRCADDASPGDVILLELQMSHVCGFPTLSGPVEYYQAAFDAIQTAVANRIVVVEPAGNYAIDLDGPTCNNLFDRTFRDSGAIMVGAGKPATDPAPRERASFSCYGDRVDVQGWGYSVVAAGYGDGYADPADTSNPDRWYTGGFSGTSSASPCVAGAAAALQGMAKHLFGTPLDPFQMRAVS